MCTQGIFNVYEPPRRVFVWLFLQPFGILKERNSFRRYRSPFSGRFVSGALPANQQRCRAIASGGYGSPSCRQPETIDGECGARIVSANRTRDSCNRRAEPPGELNHPRRYSLRVVLETVTCRRTRSRKDSSNRPAFSRLAAAAPTSSNLENLTGPAFPRVGSRPVLVVRSAVLVAVEAPVAGRRCAGSGATRSILISWQASNASRSSRMVLPRTGIG